MIFLYRLKDVEQKKLTGGDLSSLFQSFNARKSFVLKSLSTPFLFAINNYPFAWFTTLRNHNYLYTDYDLVKRNREGKNKPMDFGKLYLGRFITYQEGISDSIYMKYNTDGSPVDGKAYKVSDDQIKYTQKIISLCEKEDIELVFLTLPMYEKHVANYSEWKDKLAATLGDTYKTDRYWLDMQKKPGYDGFSRNSFQNTYASNQHMTYMGSLVATYKLVDFISSQERISLPNRKSDQKWRDIFYGEDGFFENNTPSTTDTTYKILYQSEQDEIIREILHVKKENNDLIMVKALPKTVEDYNVLKTRKIRLNLSIVDNEGKSQVVYVDLPYDAYHSSIKTVNYKEAVKKLTITQILNIQFLQV